MESSPIYRLRPGEVYPALETDLQGLSTAQAEERLALFGKNTLSEEIRPPVWRRGLTYFTHLTALVLLASGLAVMLLLGEPILGLSIWTLVVVNAGFSFWRNYRAEQAIDALRRLLPEYTRVLREGAETSLPADCLAPGDVLILAEGDNIPADARVVEEYGLRTNNATLTGDAVPARKTADASLREGISELERPNLVFAGTSVVSGTGRAVVYATGMLTQFGRIAHLTQSVKDDPSPMQVELNRVLKRVALAALGFAIFALLVGVFDEDVALGREESILLAVGILAAAIPEGLPATLTLALARAGQRLAGQGVLVKKLSVLETLGTVSTICTDKSGTLTQNQMTVREVWVAGERLHVTGVGYEPVGNFDPDPRGQAIEGDWRQLLTAVMACNNSRLTPPGPGKPHWGYLGDQTEAALRVAALKGGVEEAQLQRDIPRIHELPFDARRKRMTTIHQTLHNWRAYANGSPNAPSASFTPPFPPKVAYVKGAPREVLQLCTHILIGEHAQPLTNVLRHQILEAIDDYANRALRVMGVARRALPSDSRAYTIESVEQQLIFLGLVAMHDPPRPEVSQAIHTLRQAGIRMVMITGDYGLTGLSLARRVGMLDSDNARIVTGAELDELNEVELKALLKQPEMLFARMAPEHKLRLVATIQNMGEVVAVTGDGVNDAPALRKADVGISMGLSGTDVSKEAADIILTNDNFATVVEAIREGRALYDNLRKFITYIFSSNIPEFLPFLLTATTHLPLALHVQQILAVDIGTDLFPGLGLGSEKPEPDVMRRPPRRRTQRVVDSGLVRRALLWLGMIEAGLCYAGFFLVYYLCDRLGLISYRLAGIHPPSLPWAGLAAWPTLTSLISLDNSTVEQMALTVFYASVVVTQVGNAFACRAEVNRSSSLGWLSNRSLWLGVCLALLQLWAVIYIQPLRYVMGHTALPVWFWLWIAPFGLVLYSLEWVRKAFVRKFSHSTPNV